jgi:LysR family hydrogen peroxide-inducible transcriptional activator
MSLEDHLDKLASFRIIAGSANLGEASQRIGLSQPSLSRLINTLEDVLETKVFYRSRSGTSLTPAGKELLLYADFILNPLSDFKERIKNPESDSYGHLKIGSYESMAEYLWPKFLLSLRRKKSNFKISIHTSELDNKLYLLENRALDLIVDAEPQINGDLESFKLYKDSFNIYINPRFLKELETTSCPIIYVPYAFDSQNISLGTYVNNAKIDEPNRIKLESFTTARSFCEQGIGAAILPTRLAQTSSKLHKYKYIGLPNKNFGEHIICATIHSNRKNDPRVKKLIKDLKNWFK